MEDVTSANISTPHPVDIYVGKRLRERRTMMGMSQDAIGKAIGVTFQQIQKYERGVNRMSSSRLYDFAKALRVTVSYFFEGCDDAIPVRDAHGEGYAFGGMAEPDERASFEHEALSTRETLELVRAYHRITDPALRKSVFDLVKSLAPQEEKRKIS